MAETRLEAYLRQEAFGETLTRLYGAEGRERARTRCAEVMEGFEKSFGYPAEVPRPGARRSAGTIRITSGAACLPPQWIWTFWRQRPVTAAGSSACCPRAIP